MHEENWRPAPGFPRYRVSDQGSVERLNGKRLRPGINSHGYALVALSGDGGPKSVKVHRLVALAFLGQPPVDKPQVNHKDGKKTNNAAANLEWVSPKENIAHSYALGLTVPPVGIRVHTAKLTDESVLSIRRRVRDGESRSAVAKRFGISSKHVGDIVMGKSWGHVTEAVPA